MSLLLPCQLSQIHPSGQEGTGGILVLHPSPWAELSGAVAIPLYILTPLTPSAGQHILSSATLHLHSHRL